MSLNFDIAENQALCSDCLAIQNNLNFLCAICQSPRLLSLKQLNSLNIAHIDCDSFFASVEKSLDPALAKHPIIISSSTYGIVTTACYEARKFGIYSTMPVKKALRLCPHALIIAPKMAKYKEFSNKIFNMLLEITPSIEPASIDEFYLDLNGTQKLHKTSFYTVMQHIAHKIKNELNITVSIGLSYCKFMAKFASDLKKPFGFSVINAIEAPSLIAPYPISHIKGVGKALEQQLRKDGILYIRDLQQASPSYLEQKYGKTVQQLRLYAQGLDTRPINIEQRAQSISKEKTFYSYIKNSAELKDQLYLLAQQVSRIMKKKKLVGNAVFLKINFADKTKITRSGKIKEHSNLLLDIFEKSCQLLKKENISKPVYLIGVGVKNLIEDKKNHYTQNLDKNMQQKIALEQATDLICAKFGPNSINLARIHNKKS